MSAVLSQKPRGNHFRGVTKMVSAANPTMPMP